MPTSYPDRAVPRYRRVRCTLWTEPRFVALSITEKLVHLYLSTGPQTNAVGLYRLSVAALAEDLGIRPKIAQTAVMNVIQSMTWRYDNPTRLLWIPTWADENAPQSPNVCKAWRKALNEIQPCALRDEAEHAIRTFLTSIGKAFAEAFGKALPEAFDGSFGIQEQEAGHQEHDQEVSTHMPRAREGEHRASSALSERTACLASSMRNYRRRSEA